jgi:chemotaxis protein CheD
MVVSADRDDILVTYALGSCLGVAVYDPVTRVGGLLHAMLPDSSLDPRKAEAVPVMFLDTGVPMLFRECYRFGAKKERLLVKVAGGASFKEDEEGDYFQIGKRNALKLKALLWKNGIMIHAHDLGGRHPRTMTLELATGVVTVTANGSERVL